MKYIYVISVCVCMGGGGGGGNFRCCIELSSFGRACGRRQQVMWVMQVFADNCGKL